MGLKMSHIAIKLVAYPHSAPASGRNHQVGSPGYSPHSRTLSPSSPIPSTCRSAQPLSTSLTKNQMAACRDRAVVRRAVVRRAVVSTKAAWMKPSSSPKYRPERSMKRNSDSPQRLKTWRVAMGEAWDRVASPHVATTDAPR